MTDFHAAFEPPADGFDAPTDPGSGVLPAELAHLTWLLGTWVGVGLGQYPDIEDFRFAQHVTFTTDGRPFLYYLSRSWIIDDEGKRIRPSATETGYLRPAPDNAVEMLLVHPTGFAEIWYGDVVVTGLENATITGARMELNTDGVMRSGTAKEYVAGKRMYGLVDGNLPWAFDMAAMGHPMGNHLAALLRPEGRAAASGHPDGIDGLSASAGDPNAGDEANAGSPNGDA